MKFENVIIRIKEILLQKKWTVATAESLTAGLISSYLASISGSSGYLLGGITAYSISVKVEKLGVNKKLAKKYNAYSPKIAEQMAQGASTLFNTHIGIATTGYAEPSPDHTIYIPQAYIALSINGQSYSKQVFAYSLSRNKARKYVAKQALIFLLEVLERETSKA